MHSVLRFYIMRSFIRILSIAPVYMRVRTSLPGTLFLLVRRGISMQFLHGVTQRTSPGGLFQELSIIEMREISKYFIATYVFRSLNNPNLEEFSIEPYYR